MSLALGSTLIAVGPGLTCYYCSLILAVTLLHARRDAVGPLLLGVTALSQAVALPPIQVAQSVMVNPIGSRWFAIALLALALVMERAAFVRVLPLPPPPYSPGSPAAVDGCFRTTQSSGGQTFTDVIETNSTSCP